MDLKKLSEDYLIDATQLLNGGRWAGAYYLAGYAVECAPKACIIRRIEKTGVLFEDKKFAEKCFTHNLEELFRTADLKDERNQEISTSQEFGKNWLIVKDWNEQARYHPMAEVEARALHAAITDHTNGILQWIWKRW